MKTKPVMNKAKKGWRKRYLEQRDDMQASTRVEPRLLNEDKVLKFIDSLLQAQLDEVVGEVENWDGWDEWYFGGSHKNMENWKKKLLSSLKKRRGN